MGAVALPGFNHPMVKVKVIITLFINFLPLVSTTLWWKLKLFRIDIAKRKISVSTTLWWKLKRKENSMQKLVREVFQPPYGES